jgi:hypothetical protein
MNTIKYVVKITSYNYVGDRYVSSKINIILITYFKFIFTRKKYVHRAVN